MINNFKSESLYESMSVMQAFKLLKRILLFLQDNESILDTYKLDYEELSEINDAYSSKHETVEDNFWEKHIQLIESFLRELEIGILKNFLNYPYSSNLYETTCISKNDDDQHYLFVARIINQLEISEGKDSRIINFRLSKGYSKKLDLIEDNFQENIKLNGSEINIAMLADSENKSILPKTLLENSIEYIYYQYKNQKDFQEFVEILCREPYSAPNFHSHDFTEEDFIKEGWPVAPRLPDETEFKIIAFEKWKKRMIDKAMARLGLTRQFIMVNELFDKAYEKSKELLEKKKKKEGREFTYEKLSKEERIRSKLFEKQFEFDEWINTDIDNSVLNDGFDSDLDSNKFK